jgi:hypothetical protein
MKNFGLGVLARYSMDAKMDATGTAMTTNYTNDTALILGYNFRFFDGRIKLGFNGRLINRVEVHKDINPTTDVLDYETQGKSGTGLANDVGLVLTAPWTLLPTLGFVAHDIGDTKFNKGSGPIQTTTHPDDVKQDVDVGMAIFPIYTNHIRSTWTVEYRGLLTQSEETDKIRRVHAGVEFNFYDLFFVRLGMNQRYWTAGIEISSEHTQIQFGSYGEDVGPSGAPSEDRRIFGKFAFRF